MSSSSSSGVGIGTVCLVVFITLKCSKLVDWSWWWVLSPIWIVAGFYVIVFLLLVLKAWLESMSNPGSVSKKNQAKEMSKTKWDRLS